jgi:chloride channel 7
MRSITWLMKVIGVSFSGAAGLPIGREGPMIHSGAIVGAVVSQGKTRCCGLNKFFEKHFSEFRNDQARREFITCGAAGGVSAAFGAPVGR